MQPNSFSKKSKTIRRPVLVDNLESRQMLSGVPQAVLAAGYEPLQWNGQQAYAKPGQWLLKLNDVGGTAQAQLKAANGLINGLGLKANRQLGSDGLVSLTAPANLNYDKLTALLKNVARFAYVEPDLALWSDATPSNDVYAGNQWGLNNVGQTSGTSDADIDAPEAWDLARGDGSVVTGVIDSGVDYSHPDPAANMWINAGEVAGNGLDDDGNGYADDVHGWDFFNNDADPMDDNGHGTHVAGTIAASGNNALGVSGVTWNSKIMALKFLAADGSGSLSAAVSAINYATKMKSQYGVNIRVTNNSWGGGGYTTSLFDAIKANGQAGMLFVAAAGNGGADGVGDNNDTSPSYPGSYDLSNVISVAASDYNDVLGSFSNFGASSVDLAAPGVSILSTTRGGSYGYMSGTSMASPHVAGVAALAWGYLPTASMDTIRSALLNGTDAKSALSGKVATGGRLNAFNTLKVLSATMTAPAAPSSLTASAASSSQIDLAWADNSSNETGFRIYRSTDGILYTEVATIGAGATRFSNTGLAASTTYSYQVAAFNSYGTSARTTTATTTTAAQATTPAAPGQLGATAVSKTSISLRWTDYSSNESGFKIERYDGRRWSQIGTVGANITTFSDNNLKRNSSYSYRVRAFNPAGDSSYSNTASTKTFAADLTAMSPGASLFSTSRVSADGEDATTSDEWLSA